jgi:hypothetical protein
VIISLFWRSMSDAYSTEESHRCYGYVAAGGTADLLYGDFHRALHRVGRSGWQHLSGYSCGAWLSICNAGAYRQWARPIHTTAGHAPNRAKTRLARSPLDRSVARFITLRFLGTWRTALLVAGVQIVHRVEFSLMGPAREMICTTVDAGSRYKARTLSIRQSIPSMMLA